MSFASVMTAKAPAAWWRQGESSGTTMVDSSGNGRHGTYYGAPTFGATSLLHDGDTDTANAYSTSATTYAQVDNDTWLNVTAFSVFARILPSAVTGTQVILARFGGTVGGGDSFSLRLDDAVLRLYVNNPDGAYPSVALATVTAGVEYSVGFSYNAGNTRVFLDGAFVTQLVSTARAVSSALTVGRSGYGEPFGGVLDEIAFWSGTALTDADHADLHTAAVTPPTVAAHELTLNATAAAATASFSLTHTPPPAEVTLAGIAAPAAGSFTLNLPAAAVALTLAGTAAPASATFAIESATSSAVDTSARYENDGYNYDGIAAVFYEPPITEPPAHIRRAKVLHVHQSMSAPVLVNGRPT